ncbi:glycosyl transferase [Purpureocillium lavendulum]|uniref:Glycosyl transferase n=1 Tax=Purpureocillium lavendulum TaxID=1247861 RepID=A0AB34FZC2_9HYPO|nr:glycosyl transferase [Purpureocillium lavendulum]
MSAKPGQFVQGKRIIVAGGGIAGLAFVCAISQLWDQSLKRPEITVIERETRLGSIDQDPYVLTLNGGNQNEGLVALQHLDLLEGLTPRAILNSGAIWVWSDNWKLLASINPTAYGDLPVAAMRIARRDVKLALLERAEETANALWQWGWRCTGAERLANGQVRVTAVDDAGNTRTQECDLLVVADGPSSKIRAGFRPYNTKLQYAGATQIGGISHLPKGLPKPIHEDYGLQMSSGEGVCCIYTPFDEKTVGWQLSRVEPEREAKYGPFSPSELSELKKEAIKTGSMFQEPFKTIVEATDPATAFVRPAKERHPFKHEPSLSGVVFIGDANHVLSPYEHVGANIALKDGWDLADQICRNSTIGATVDAYDRLSIPRAEALIKHSHERIGFGHSTGFKWMVYKYGMAAQRALAKKS